MSKVRELDLGQTWHRSPSYLRYIYPVWHHFKTDGLVTKLNVQQERINFNNQYQALKITINTHRLLGISATDRPDTFFCSKCRCHTFLCISGHCSSVFERILISLCFKKWSEITTKITFWKMLYRMDTHLPHSKDVCQLWPRKPIDTNFKWS